MGEVGLLYLLPVTVSQRQISPEARKELAVKAQSHSEDTLHFGRYAVMYLSIIFKCKCCGK